MAPTPAIGALISSQSVKSETQTWTQQSVSDGTKVRFRQLLNGANPGADIAAPKPNSSPSIADNLPWNDLLNREELMRNLNSLGSVPSEQMPAAAARVTAASLEFGLKLKGVSDATKSNQDNINTLLHG